ncbi:MAG: endolytic transglycosylase MltG, partial [Polymorphobacter sp.]
MAAPAQSRWSPAPWLALLAALLLVGTAVFVAQRWSARADSNAPQVMIDIAPGSSLRQAALTLRDAGLVDQPDLFVALARAFGGGRDVQAGRYAIPQGLGYGGILALLQSGRVATTRVTIPEGWPSVLVAERLRANVDLAGDIAVPPEGSVLPDTYAFARGSPRSDAVATMQAAMQRALTELWPKRTARTVVKTPAEAVILASIVEKETGKASERRLIAGVYSNRLRIGMKLDADPTVIYPLTAGKPLGRRIRRSELRNDNGYNTYARAGLPKGPIANPGRESIAAVLDPAPTDALYFVADGSGGHV